MPEEFLLLKVSVLKRYVRGQSDKWKDMSNVNKEMI